MLILITDDLEMTDRDYEIGLVGSMIEDAAKGSRPITAYALAASIIDEIDNARAEAEALASLPAEPPKPRIRVRAATQHAA